MNTSYGRIRNLLAVKTDVCLNDRCRGQESKALREKLERNVWREYAAFQTCSSGKSKRSCFGRCYGEMTAVVGLAPFSFATAPGLCAASCVTHNIPGIRDQSNRLSNHFQLQPSIEHCTRHGRVRLYYVRYRVRARVYTDHNIDGRLPCTKTT